MNTLTLACETHFRLLTSRCSDNQFVFFFKPPSIYYFVVAAQETIQYGNLPLFWKHKTSLLFMEYNIMENLGDINNSRLLLKLILKAL